MKKLVLFLTAGLFYPSAVLANPACAVCTVAIGASLEIARKLGVADAVVGLWAGALLTLLGYWTILFFDKKKLALSGARFCADGRFRRHDRVYLYQGSRLYAGDYLERILS